MTPLSPEARQALEGVLRHARDDMRDFHPDSLGAMLLEQRHHRLGAGVQLLDEVRLALGVELKPGTLAAWGRGKSRQQVAEALERVLDLSS